jgi:alkyldihydroxyacetonephosphate synthase
MNLPQSLAHIRASASPADRVAYARDLWPRHHFAVRGGDPGQHKPGMIVWPTSTKEVAEIVRYANDTETPVVPFGAGSGVCGGVLPNERVIVLDLKRMARWRALDERAPWIDVEAGHMGVPFEEELNRRGLTLGHFPSSILCSTVGGWVAGRSAGQCSGYYGKIEDMVIALECVTGAGEIVTLHHRVNGPSLVPLVVGSEGTLAVVTSCKLRLHPFPTARAYAAWSFRTTQEGWEAIRAMYQDGLRPAVCRLYDPFDAMLARQGGVKRGAKGGKKPSAPGRGATILRSLLRRPGFLNKLVDATGSNLLGGAMLVVIFEGTGDEPGRACDRARRLVDSRASKFEGEGPARKWLQHRYSVSYRQAPAYALGAWVDTMEVAAPWSRLGAMYDGVRKALGPYVFVMAHFSHAYPDGCCIYFTFAGSAAPGGGADWDVASTTTYDRAWRAALDAVVNAGGSIAHHHGVGRSKAPRLRAELGGGVDTFLALKRAFDPKGILNPGALLVGDESRTPS